MSYLFLEYPKCNTCRNAKKWLDEHKITYEDRHIIDRNPSVEELTEWIKRSKLPLKNFFNISGLVYKEMKLKDKLPAFDPFCQFFDRRIAIDDMTILVRYFMLIQPFLCISACVAFRVF